MNTVTTYEKSCSPVNANQPSLYRHCNDRTPLLRGPSPPGRDPYSVDVRRLGIVLLTTVGLAVGCSSSHHAKAVGIRCLDLRNAANVAPVRHLPPPELRRYLDACNLTYTKDCTGQTSGEMTCEIRDKSGKLVRTYTTRAP